MSEKSYDGKPIDMSWKDSPWMNEGETISVHDSEGNGTMTTTDWPEGATPKEELNEDQIKAIKIAAKHRDIDNSRELVEMADIDKSPSYVSTVLRSHWNGRYWSAGTKESARKIDLVRKAILNGESCRDTSERFNIPYPTLNRIIKAEHTNKDTKTSPLEYDASSGEWKECGTVKEEKTGSSDKTGDEQLGVKQISDSEIENIRRMALDGMVAGEISENYDVGQAAVQHRLNGSVGDDSNSEIPPLEYSPDKNCWEVPEDDDSKEQTMLDTTPDDGQEENHVNGEREITAPESDAGPKAKTVAVVGAFIGFVVGFAIKTLGDSE